MLTLFLLASLVAPQPAPAAGTAVGTPCTADSVVGTSQFMGTSRETVKP
jgi:hypothetical protein